MGRALRLASNFVILNDTFNADIVDVTPNLYETIRLTESGTFVIVPRNTWHTARIRSHSIMMLITPGEGTVNAEEPVRSTDR